MPETRRLRVLLDFWTESTQDNAMRGQFELLAHLADFSFFYFAISRKFIKFVEK
jgi:hypothetical protein